MLSATSLIYQSSHATLFGLCDQWLANMQDFFFSFPDMTKCSQLIILAFTRVLSTASNMLQMNPALYDEVGHEIASLQHTVVATGSTVMVLNVSPGMP